MKILAKTTNDGFVVEITKEEMRLLSDLNGIVSVSWFDEWRRVGNGHDLSPALLAVESYVNDFNLSMRLKHMFVTREKREEEIYG